MIDRRPHILRKTAQDLRAQARKLEKDAANIERELSTRRKLNKLYRQSAGSISPSAFAKAHRIPLATVLSWQKRHMKEEKESCVAKRDREIMRLVAKGWTNAEIGRAIDLHPNSVSRIISRQRQTSLFPK